MQPYIVTCENTAGSPAETTVDAKSPEHAAFLAGRNLGRDSRANLVTIRPAETPPLPILSGECGECGSPAGEECAAWCTGAMPAQAGW